MEQTAIDFVFEKLANQGLLVTKDYENFIAYREAKEMEKEQTIDFAKTCLNKAKDLDVLTAFLNVDKYYNENFNTKER